MTKVLTVDDIEIEFEKQNSSVSCKWCVYLRIRKDKTIIYFYCKCTRMSNNNIQALLR